MIDNGAALRSRYFQSDLRSARQRAARRSPSTDRAENGGRASLGGLRHVCRSLSVACR